MMNEVLNAIPPMIYIIIVFINKKKSYEYSKIEI